MIRAERMDWKGQPHGVSLVEMLVVFSVISLLCAMLLPAIQPGRRFRAVTGVIEQFTNLSDGFDYYQLLTLSQEGLVGLCPADPDRDGDVDLRDYSLFVEQLLLPSPSPEDQSCLAADLNRDGTVGLTDLAAFNAAWTARLKGFVVAGSLAPPPSMGRAGDFALLRKASHSVVRRSVRRLRETPTLSLLTNTGLWSSTSRAGVPRRIA